MSTIETVAVDLVRAARKDLAKEYDRTMSTLANLADALGQQHKQAVALNRSRLDHRVPELANALAILVDTVEAATATPVEAEPPDDDEDLEEQAT